MNSLEPDLDLARRFLEARGPKGVEVLLCGVTGAHAYGFPSVDSDIDIKGLHLAPTRDVLGLKGPGGAFDRIELFDGTECDVTTHEATHAIQLLLSGNGNVLEHILSPLQLFDTEPTRQLRHLAVGSLSKSFHRHYKGYFRGMRREHRTRGTLKTALYSYRAPLTGYWLLTKGELVTDVRPLADELGLVTVPELVVLKTEGEQSPIPGGLNAIVQKDWVTLEEHLSRALDQSTLPQEPPNRKDWEAWLVEARLSRLTYEK
ncbi:MAG: nucleotidyltransferase domain-containing protein [Acidobacteriota bacterium]